MIRRRKSRIDDKYIRRLFYRELLPHTRRENPAFQMNPKELQARLNRGHTYVAVNRQWPVGFVTIYKVGETVFIDLLAVDRRQHKKGLGSQLLDKAETIGKKQGCRKVCLYVDYGNFNAQQFYAKKGYALSESFPDIRCFLLIKTLD